VYHATMTKISAEQNRDMREQAAAWRRTRDARRSGRGLRFYQCPRCTTSASGRRSGFLIGVSGRPAG